MVEESVERISTPRHNWRGGQISQIQILRFFSALFVSFYHFGFLDALGRDHDIWFVNGVYIFYAISGFVILLSTEKGISHFMTKRLIRLLPLYWFLTVITYIAMLILPAVFPYKPTIVELFKSLFFIPYAHQSTSMANAVFPIVSMGHTVQTTMLFYVIFWLAAKLSHRYRGVITSLVLGAVVVSGFIFKPTDIILKFYTRPDAIYFIVGILVYYFCKCEYLKINVNNTLVSVFVIILFLGSMCTHVRWIVSIQIFFMMFLLVQYVKVSENKMNRAFFELGNWSFSYFLIHLYFVRFAEVFGGIDFTIKAVLCDVIAVVVAWAVSKVLYILIEQRLTNKLKGYLIK